MYCLICICHELKMETCEYDVKMGRNIISSIIILSERTTGKCVSWNRGISLFGDLICNNIMHSFVHLDEVCWEQQWGPLCLSLLPALPPMRVRLVINLNHIASLKGQFVVVLRCVLKCRHGQH